MVLLPETGHVSAASPDRNARLRPGPGVTSAGLVVAAPVGTPVLFTRSLLVAGRSHYRRHRRPECGRSRARRGSARRRTDRTARAGGGGPDRPALRSRGIRTAADRASRRSLGRARACRLALSPPAGDAGTRPQRTVLLLACSRCRIGRSHKPRVRHQPVSQASPCVRAGGRVHSTSRCDVLCLAEICSGTTVRSGSTHSDVHSSQRTAA